METVAASVAVTEAPVVTETVVVEPQVVAVETTHPEVIETVVEEQPQFIVDADVPVAEEVVAEAEPVANVVEAPITEEPVGLTSLSPSQTLLNRLSRPRQLPRLRRKKSHRLHQSLSLKLW